MPPKRGKMRAAQNYAHAVHAMQSDYDTDVANLTETAIVTSSPAPPRTNEELNLSVLQRHNPDVLGVLSLAPFAVVYLFSATNQQWEKCGVEGTLFVCALQQQVTQTGALVERYSVTVLNRKGLDNFFTELYSSEDVDITDDYVILQVEAEDGTPQIYGLWIFSEPPPSSTADAREKNAAIIQECAIRAGASRKIDTVPAETIEPERYEEQHVGYENGHAATFEQNIPAGQQLNINDLFGRSQQALAMSQGMHYNQHAGQGNYGQQQQQYQPQHFDVQTGGGGQSQPDVLMSLFKNARSRYTG